MASRIERSAASTGEAYQNIPGSLSHPGAVRIRKCNESPWKQRELLARTGRLHAVQDSPLTHNDGLNRAQHSMIMDGERIATRNVVASAGFGHTVTVQWLTSITEDSPDVASQESVIGSNGSKNENLIGLGIRHISQSRFNYALSANPNSDFLGNKTPVGLGIRQISRNQFEYALSANPNANFLGDRPPIGLGIRHLSDSTSEDALSTHLSGHFMGRDELSRSQVLNANQPQSIKKAEKLTIVNTVSPQIPAENMTYFTRRHSLNMSRKKKGKDKRDWPPFSDEDEDFMSPACDTRR